MLRILVTGGCGFLGHHFIEHVLKNTDWEIVCVDSLSYAASGFDRLRDIDAFDDKRVHRFTHDISRPLSYGLAYEIGQVDFIVHMAAETHVDNSIKDPRPFVYSNVVGTMEMLEFARQQSKLKRFIYFSTDEIFGPAAVDQEQIDITESPQLKFTHHEWDRYNSTNPYSATKAGGEELCLAYANTYNMPIIITHCMNLFGERQHPEKFVPQTIRKVLNGERVFIHSDSTKRRAGSRFYLHARNAADAVLFLLDQGGRREKYNIAGQREVSNLELAQMVAELVGEPLHFEMMDFHSSRPGHDLRYALDGQKLADLGWEAVVPFKETLVKTVNWFLSNRKWLEVK